MIHRIKKDVYVDLKFNTPKAFLIINIRFHDGYQKVYKLDEYEFRALRCSARDHSENLIQEYYESLGTKVPDYQVYFS